MSFDLLPLLGSFAIGGLAGVLLGLALAKRRASSSVETASGHGRSAASATSQEVQRLTQELAERTRELDAANTKLAARHRVEQTLSLSDPLTGIANRSLLIERVDHGIVRNRRNNGRVAVLMIDVQDFKHIDESHGRAVSDRLLVEVARRLRTAMRSGDTVARLTGERFGIALEGVFEPEDIQHATTSALNAFKEPFELDGQSLKVSARSSSALFPVDGEDAETLLRVAEHTLTQSQRRSGSKV